MTPSPRQIEITRLLATGLEQGEIATKLGIERTTVETHVKRLRQKLGARNVIQMVVLMREWIG